MTDTDLAERIRLLEAGVMPRPPMEATWPLQDPPVSLATLAWQERQRERNAERDAQRRLDQDRAEVAAEARRRHNEPLIADIDRRIVELQDARRPLVDRLAPVDYELRRLHDERGTLQ
jgi:hypothetical protein